MTKELKLGPVEWAMLITLSLIWGATFLFARIAVQEIPPLTLSLCRVALAALALQIYASFRYSKAQNSKGRWRDFAIMGCINNAIPFVLIFYGQLEIGAGLAAIINAMTPIWTIIIAQFATSDERMSANKLLGIALGFVGVGILIGTAALSGLAGSTWAQLSVLGATISYGFASVFGRRFVHVSAVETAKGQLTMSSIIIAPIALLVDTPWLLPVPSTLTIISVVTLAILCSAFAYILYFKILATAGAVNVTLVTFLIPPSAIVLGVIFLGETLQAHQIIGTVCILVGLIVIDGRLWKKRIS